MTQHHPSDSPQISSESKQSLKPVETTSHSESLILMNHSTLQETDGIRVELYAEMPQIQRQTVVRETISVKQSLAQATTP